MVKETGGTGWPYLFCDNCKKLAPINEATNGYIECLICGMIILEERRLRKVYLTPEEAKLRNLPTVKY